MENNGYHLDLFINSMIRYFNEVLIHKNYVSTSFRKYSLRDGEDNEFSFQIKVPSSRTDGDEQILNSAFFTEEDFKTLINFSQLWSLHLADVSIKGSRLIFKLNQPQALYRVLKSILNEQTKYGVNFTLPQGVKVSMYESLDKIDLTKLRMKLIKETAENIITSINFEEKEESWSEIFLSSKNVSNKIISLCGVVVNAETGSKENEISPDDYYQIRMKDIRAMSDHKYWQMENDQLLHDLTDADVKMALLQVNPKNVVSLKMGSSINSSGGSMSKGAAFVLYNHARLVALQRKFDELCKRGLYSVCPDLEQVDFSLLTEKEEWYILFNHLLEYPTIIQKIAKELCRGVFNTHQVCRFLTDLSLLFSVYYRRVRVLLEPREHLLPMIHARITLLKGVQQVMENALSLLNIKLVEAM